MIAEQRGTIPNYSGALARTHLRNAWSDIRNLKGWSFQVGNTGYATPALVNAGSATTTLGSPLVTGDVAATAAWLATSATYPYSLITQRQFRLGASTIYNILAMGNNGSVAYLTIFSAGSGQTPGVYLVPVNDATGPGSGGLVSITVDADGTVTQTPIVVTAGSGYETPVVFLVSGGTPALFVPILFATLTLDRNWIDINSGPGLGYSIYQPYIVAPVRNFLAWEFFMDVRNVIHLDVNNTRGLWEKVNEADPQRQIFSNPGNVIPHGVDNRLGSSTPGWAVYELYPQPQSVFTYTVGYSWLGPELTDTPGLSAVPNPMTEHVVKTLGRIKAYEYAEANKNAANPRGAGADFRFLMQTAMAEYKDQLHEIRSIDRDIYDAWKTQMKRYTNIGVVATFDPSTGTVMSRNL
jgi:hypothetical protein